MIHRIVPFSVTLLTHANVKWTLFYTLNISQTVEDRHTVTIEIEYEVAAIYLIVTLTLTMTAVSDLAPSRLCMSEILND